MNCWMVIPFTSEKILSKNIIITLYDISGRDVFKRGFKSTGLQNEFKLEASELHSGYYVINIDIGNSSYVSKLIIQ